MSLAGRNTSSKATSILVVLGLIGGSFFYGEVVITPAISVMSAIEGLEIAAPPLILYCSLLHCRINDTLCDSKAWHWQCW